MTNWHAVSRAEALEDRRHWVDNRAALYVYVHGLHPIMARHCADSDYRRLLPHRQRRDG